jgi:ribonuclease-3
MNFDAKGVEHALGYRFKDRSTLAEALTHPSCSKDKNSERLEFLGDAVLELCVSAHLYDVYPAATEGELTKRRAAYVCRGSLIKAAKKTGMGGYILLGRGEELAGGREKPSVLENAMEAVFGAVFLDGGLQAAMEVVRKVLLSEKEMRQDQGGGADTNQTLRIQDYKSLLQETVQAGGGETICYETYRREGPPHDAVFYVRLYIGNKQAGEGQGKSKKEAEQQAAQKALVKMYKLKFKE